MDSDKVEKLKKIFASGCFTEPSAKSKNRPGYFDDKKRTDKGPKEYRVCRSETLESIADNIHNNKENKYPDITDDFKKLSFEKETYEHAWQYLAMYNYGAIDPSVLNYLMCEEHGFDFRKDRNGNYSNLTVDHKNYKYKGGEILYYSVKKYAKTGINKVYIRPDDTPGLILYPSFACPALVGRDSMLSILVLGTPSKPITSEKVNIHLKILPWDYDIGDIKYAMLKYNIYAGFSGSLFNSKEEAEKNIKCEKIGFSKIIEDSHGRYALIPEQKVIDTYKDYTYTEIYRIEIHLEYLPFNDSFLEEAYYNLFWINRDEEREDHIIQEKMNYFFGKKIYKSGEGKWLGFAVEMKSLFFDKLQPKYPICSYHPFLYKKKNYLNIAHMGDAHLTARLTMMKENQAKTVEAEDIPTVGSMLNDHFATFFDLMCQAGSDSNIDIVLISGDIVDYLKSFYPVEFVDKRNEYLDKGEYGYASELELDKFYNTVGRIWKAVGVGSEDEANKKYQDCVDLVTFYSIISHFYQNYKKPVFLVSGNHDAYLLPYGVSPRILKIKGWRANAGIPADMNLTFYEAILSYGKKYGEALGGLKMLIKEKFEIFYSLFTPMKDFCLNLPGFTLVGLSWGEDEDKIDFLDKIPIIGYLIGRDDQESSHPPYFGHLPRADDAISEDQMKIIKFAVDKNRTKNILFSHFTFVSYEEGKSLKSFEEGDVEFDWHWGASKYDMGTFEKNRKAIYEKYLYKEKKLHYVLTGHSHRRGLYEITDIDYSGDNSVKTRFHGFSNFENVKGPKIIVSDSAGPIPRYNYDGEFSGWGSSIPSYTRMVFNTDDGNLIELSAVASKSASAKPRFAVALEYFYLLQNVNVLKNFGTVNMSEKDYWERTNFDFYLFNCYLPGKDDKGNAKNIYLDIAEISFYYYYNDKFNKVPLSCSKSSSDDIIRCSINFKDMESATLFKRYACNNNNRTVFASVKFKRLSEHQFSQYNYDLPYNFEIKIEKVETGSAGKQNVQLIVKRETNYCEFPDLDWRRFHFKEKYGSEE